MSRRLLLLIPAVVGVAACSSATSPATQPKTETQTFVGSIAGAATAGTFKATFTTTTSSGASASSVHFDIRRGQSSGPSASITITLLNGTTLTLTGSLSGGSFTVSDNAGDSCTGSIANYLNAQCTAAGIPGSLNLIGVLQAASATSALKTYCGLENIPGVTGPDASLLIGIADTVSFVARVSVSDNTLTLFVGTANGSTFSDSAISKGYTNKEVGTFTSTTATGADSASHNAIGAFTATSPCNLTAAVLSPTHMTFTAVANGAAPAPQSAIVSPATLGPMTVTIPSSVNWISSTIVYDKVTLAVSTSLPPGTYSTVVTLHPQFAANTLVDTVSYTVTAQSTGETLWLGSSDGQLMGYTNLTTTNAAPAVSNSSGAITGIGYMTFDQSGNMWTTSAYRTDVFEFAPTVLSGALSATAIKSPGQKPTGLAFDKGGTLWVADSGSAGQFYGYTASDLANGRPSHTYRLSSIVNGPSITSPKFAAVVVDKNNYLFISDEANGYVYDFQIAGQLTGSNLALTAWGGFKVGGSTTLRPQAMAIDAGGHLWVSALATGQIFEYPGGDPNGVASPTPVATVSVTGVADSITSLAFDGSGNLWIVEGATANASTGLAMISASSLQATGSFSVTPTVTFAESQPGPQAPKAMAFSPVISGLPLLSRRH